MPDPVPSPSVPVSGPRPRVGPELVRWLVLLAAGWWLLHPFMTGRAVGTGDAIWYANMLDDFVAQWRAGVFPVFAGQTESAFNGAVYPLRVAPLYQHLGGTLDLLTGRQLGVYALQHALVVLCGFLGLAGAYLAAARLAPSQRWTACLLAVLYLSCPGVLGTICTQDLYMTWMTVPFLPPAVYGILRTFRHDDLRSQIWLAAPLAALWFAHPPVALWMGLIAAATQLARLLTLHQCRAAWRRAAGGALLFLALGHYPFVSVAALKVAGAGAAVTTELAEPERIINAIREVFPGVLLPLTPSARKLSDLQLGYALWGVLFVTAVAGFGRDAPRGVGLLAASCLALLLLLLPVPGVTDWLWQHLPESIKRITFYWPMQRFYLLIAALLGVSGPLAWAALAGRWPRSRTALQVGLVLAASWSLWEARQFGRAVTERTYSPEATECGRRPENLLLARFSYNLFPARPAYFSNGAMDPLAETRLLDSGTVQLRPAPPPPALDRGRLRGSIDTNPGILRLAPTLRLEPARRYSLELEFPAPDTTGVLQLAGRNFFREYALPESGGPLAFGAKPGNSRTLTLWTSQPEPEEITLRFIPTGPGARPADFADFAGYRFAELDPERLPVTVESLLPFRALVRTDAAAWLETPRMFQPGYVAEVDDRPVEVQRSPHGLAMVAIPGGGGRNVVELRYRGPFALRASYFGTLAAWGILLGGVLAMPAAGAWRTRRHRI